MRKFTGDSGFLANSTIILSGLAALLGSLGFIGWLTGLKTLASIHVSYIPMPPDTAISFMLLSGVLLLISRKNFHGKQLTLFQVLAGLITIYGLLKFVEYIVKVDLTFANLLFPIEEWLQGAPVNRMSPVAGALFFLAGSATFMRLLEFTSGKFKDVISFNGLIVSISALISIIGYAFGTPMLYGTSIIPMAVTTAASFLLLGIALIISAGPESAMMLPFTSSSTQSLLLRAFLPLAVISVLAQGLLDEWLGQAYQYNHAMFTMTTSLFFAVVAAFIVAQVSKIVGGMVERANEERNESERALKQSQATAHVGHWTWDTETNTVIWSDEMKRIFGLDPEASNGDLSKIIETAIHPDDREKVNKSNERVLSEQKPAGMEYRIVWGDGTVRTVWAQPDEAEKDGSGKIIKLSGIVQDITERKLTEEALRESQKRYRTIVENSHDMIWMLDRQGNFTFANPKAEKITGYHPEEWLGRSFTPMIAPKDLLRMQEVLIENLKGKTKEYEVAIMRADGSEIVIQAISIPIVEKGEVVGTVSFGQDITERKKALVALRENEGRYRHLVEMSPDAILIHSEGTIVLANPSAAMMFGAQSPAELVGTKLFDRVHPEYRNIVKGRVEIITEKSGAVPRIEEKLLRLDGSSFDAEVVGAPFTYMGKPAVQVIARDISERKRAEDALKASEERFRNLSSMASEGIFVHKNGVILEANHAVTTMFGFNDPSELIGRSGLETINFTPESRKIVIQHIEHASDELYEVEIARSGRPNIHAETQGKDIEWRGEMARLVYFRDITERKAADEQLRLSEERYRTFFEDDLTGDYITSVDAKLLDANPKFLKMFGFGSLEEAQNAKTDNLYVDPLDRITLLNLLKENGKLEKYALSLRRVNGEIIEIEENVVGSFDENGKLVHLKGYMIEVTERNQAERALRESELKLLQSQATAKLGHYTFDIASGMWESSKALDNVFGINDDYVRNVDGWLGIVNQEDREEMSRYLTEHILAGRNPFNKEYRITRISDGQVRWVHGQGALEFDKQGDPVLMFGIIQDITEQIEAISALSESEEKFRAIFDSVRDAIFVRPISGLQFDPFMLVNKAACDLLGYSEEELLRMTPYNIEYGKPQDEINSRVHKILESGSYQFETEFQKKDGTIFPVDINLHVFSLRGQPMIVSVVRDISARKLLEEQFRQAHKMEAIGRLAGGVAHDFNNLLTVILGHCDLAMLSMKENDPLMGGLTEILGAAERAAGLTRQLLAFGRKQALAPKIIDLNASLINMEKMLKRMIGEDVAMMAVNAPDLYKVKVDQGQIEQVIINIAINARDAMPNGGKLTIETSNVNLDEDYVKLHREASIGPHVMVAISDTGVGMTPEVMEKIFEPFFTTKPIGKGTGLGLSTVFGIIKQSGGSINVYSEPGEGTTFKIYLPAIKTESVDEIHTRQYESSKLQGNETILVVEDEEAVRKVAVKFLETYGYNVIWASSGREAINNFLRKQTHFDLLLTDVIMPHMKGNELAAVIRQKMPDMKVIYMSGYTANAILHDGIIDPGTAFITKPFGPVELLTKVREELDSGKENGEGSNN